MTKEEAIEQLKMRLKPNTYGGECALGYNKKYCFGKSDLEAIEKVLNMLKEKDAEIEKKDKMIDLIIDFFYKLTQESPGTTIHYLEKNGFDTSKCNNCSPGNDCRKCFKQYFERKAKDGRL